MNLFLISVLSVASATVAGRAADAWAFSMVHGFGHLDRAVTLPSGPLLRASDGAFYGVADGRLYGLGEDGSGFRLIPFVPGDAAADQVLLGTLWEGPNGRLYGATQDDDRRTAGVLAFQSDGSSLQLMHRLEETNALWSIGEQLFVAADGSVIGQAWKRGTSHRDIVFRLTAAGAWQVLRELPTGDLNVFPPNQRGLAAGANGALYGVTPNGGAAASGVVFRIQPDGSDYAVLHEFGGTNLDLAQPAGPLRRASDGNLYGLAAVGFLSTNSGAVYRVTPAGEVAVVRYLTRGPDQPLPEGGLTEGSDGRLYGTAQEDAFGIFSKIYRLNKDGSGFEIIYTSTAVSVGIAALTEGADGRFYTTSLRGPTDMEFGGEGAIFRINGDGSGFTNLWRFHPTGGDGQRPFGPIVIGSDGAIYGTTVNGGEEDGGTVFRVNRDGSSPRILHSFVAKESHGLNPFPGLLEGQDGALYGATTFGGANNRGTVFRIHKDGSEFAVLHQFAATSDGASPMARLTQGPDGTLFGTTGQGGTNGSSGTVFRLNTNGSGYRVLHDFRSATQSINTTAPLLFGQDGELYSVTSTGGPENGGTIFALGTNGAGFRVLHTFTTNAGAAFRPSSATLVEGDDGKLYGTTGGGLGFGAIYRIQRDGGGYEVLHRFTGGAGGNLLAGGLTRVPDGGWGGAVQAPGAGGTNYADGLLYRLDPSGSNFVVLASFRAGAGYFAPSQLALGPDAALYGADQNGAEIAAGQIFRLTPPDYRPRFVAGTGRRSASGEFTAQFTGTVGQHAVLESSPDLQQWNSVAPVLFTGEPAAFSNATAEPLQFYRIRVP